VKSKFGWILGGTVIFLLCLGVTISKSRAEKGNLSERYDFYTVKKMSLSKEVDATGTVQATDKKELYSDFAGTVTQVSVRAGDRVKQGDQLLTISSSDLKAEWTEADSTLKQAEINLKQAQAELALLTTEEPSITEITGATAKVGLAKQQVKEAREKVENLKIKNDGYYSTDFDKLVIRAPFDGKVAWVEVRRGDKITGQTLLATVINPATLEIEALIDENDYQLVKTGQPVKILDDSDEPLKNKAMVTEVSQLGEEDEGVVSFPIRIKLNGEASGLQPGMTVDLSVIVAECPNVSAIPAGSVFQEDGRDMVIVKQAKKLVKKEVKLGFQEGKYWQVISGVKCGTTLAVQKPAVENSRAATGSSSRRNGIMSFGR